MDSITIRFLFIASFLFFVPSSISFAQESELEGENKGSVGSIKDLGRRGMNFQNVALGEKADIDSMGINLGLDSAGLGIFDAFFTSFSIILASEIGDETFIIAALMAMRHPKSTVLSGALAALIVMTIATIALATHKNALGVAVGAIIGHTICTSVAVVGGSMLAAKISQRTVATVGGFLILCFSLSSYFYPPL